MPVIYFIISVVWECLKELPKLFLTSRKSYTAKVATTEASTYKPGH